MSATTTLEGPIGRRNVVWGWITMLLGASLGTVLMAWSFDGPFPAPAGFEDYGQLARRLARLAHVAWFMLPLINVVLGRDLDGLAVPDLWKNVASFAAIVAMFGIPAGLLLAALVAYPLLLVSVMSGSGLFLAVAIVAWGKLRQTAA